MPERKMQPAACHPSSIVCEGTLKVGAGVARRSYSEDSDAAREESVAASPAAVVLAQTCRSDDAQASCFTPQAAERNPQATSHRPEAGPQRIHTPIHFLLLLVFLLTPLPDPPRVVHSKSVRCLPGHPSQPSQLQLQTRIQPNLRSTHFLQPPPICLLAPCRPNGIPDHRHQEARDPPRPALRDHRPVAMLSDRPFRNGRWKMLVA